MRARKIYLKPNAVHLLEWERQMTISGKSLIFSFIKSGQLIATSFLFLTFMGMFFHGKYVWTEPNIVVLTFEILLSASWLIGSIIDTAQTAINSCGKKRDLTRVN